MPFLRTAVVGWTMILLELVHQAYVSVSAVHIVFFLSQYRFFQPFLGLNAGLSIFQASLLTYSFETTPLKVKSNASSVFSFVSYEVNTPSRICLLKGSIGVRPRRKSAVVIEKDLGLRVSMIPVARYTTRLLVIENTSTYFHLFSVYYIWNIFQKEAVGGERRSFDHDLDAVITMLLTDCDKYKYTSHPVVMNPEPWKYRSITLQTPTPLQKRAHNDSNPPSPQAVAKRGDRGPGAEFLPRHPSLPSSPVFSAGPATVTAAESRARCISLTNDSSSVSNFSKSSGKKKPVGKEDVREWCKTRFRMSGKSTRARQRDEKRPRGILSNEGDPYSPRMGMCNRLVSGWLTCALAKPCCRGSAVPSTCIAFVWLLAGVDWGGGSLPVWTYCVRNPWQDGYLRAERAEKRNGNAKSGVSRYCGVTNEIQVRLSSTSLSLCASPRVAAAFQLPLSKATRSREVGRAQA
ncbi:uncharacterized protein CLUP02_12821 [Colletotrichum lupini]|uniref:Uncharacterized protein n=1 Tax=Colletotrichum lupini TaxID=145971 RepID=A0A9Q8T2Y6_9PEZI|nr:uncharacterized protein CLUP02_12821 [Colletotrichum lupini]UQC87317.1 hypothetical protein CLUP02_12821 [Colletotrichum lupini]